MTSEETKKCPFCEEEILAVAKKCKHCGEFLNEASESTPKTKEATRELVSNVVSDAEWNLVEEYGIDFSEMYMGQPRYILAQSWRKDDGGNFHIYDMKTNTAISRLYPEDGEKAFIDPFQKEFGVRITPRGSGGITFGSGIYANKNSEAREQYAAQYGRQGCYYITDNAIIAGPSELYTTQG